MNMFLIFLISLTKSDDIYTNLGVILSPQPNVLSFDTFASLDAKVTVDFKLTEKYQDLLFSKCGDYNLTKHFLNFEHESTSINPHKILQNAIKRHLTRYLLQDKISNTNFSRKKRQILEMAAGALGYEFLHEIYNTFSSNTKINKINVAIAEVVNTMTIQEKEIKNKIEFMTCEVTKNEIIHHENNIKLLIFEELKTLDNVIYSLIYRTGLHSEINMLFVRGCLELSLAHVEFCQELIESKKFGVKINEIEIIHNNNAKISMVINVEITFPFKIKSENILKLYNVGVITNQTAQLIGKRISSLKNINAVQLETKTGFSLKDCTALHSFVLCANENIRENSLKENICLKSILKNQTYGCETEIFENTRPCLVHNLGKNSFISAGIPYKIIKTFSTNPRTVKTTHGIEGVLPLNFNEKNLLSTTLVCGKVTKSLYSLESPLKNYNIISGPDIITDLIKLNFTDNSELEEKLEIAKWSLKQSLIDIVTEEKTNDDWLYIAIISFLILIIFLKCCIFGKFEKYLKKSQIDIV